jgi:hypothetical protein
LPRADIRRKQGIPAASFHKFKDKYFFEDKYFGLDMSDAPQAEGAWGGERTAEEAPGQELDAWREKQSLHQMRHDELIFGDPRGTTVKRLTQAGTFQAVMAV